MEDNREKGRGWTASATPRRKLQPRTKVGIFVFLLFLLAVATGLTMGIFSSREVVPIAPTIAAASTNPLFSINGNVNAAVVGTSGTGQIFRMLEAGSSGDAASFRARD